MKKFTIEELQEMSVSYLKMYPASEKMYATDDGNFFLVKNPAQDHANKTSSDVYTFERDKVGSGGAPNDPAADLVDLHEKLKTLDVEKMEYNAARAMLGALKFTAESGKKEDVIKALVGYKAEILK